MKANLTKILSVFLMILTFSTLAYSQQETAINSKDSLQTKNNEVLATSLDSLKEVVKADTATPYLTDSTITKMFISAEELRQIVPIDSSLAIGDTANNDDFYYYTGTSKRCPSDMVLVEDSVFAYSFLGKRFYKKNVSVCVDRYEFPNIRDRYPMVDVTKFEAEMQCESRGKRLCSDLEWVSSCKNGRNATVYPYGDSLSINNCNTHTSKAERTGHYRNCHTKTGVFDMVGNVSEWTAGGGVGMYGGSYESQTRANCELWTSKSFKYKSKKVGFRCCKDPAKK